MHSFLFKAMTVMIVMAVLFIYPTKSYATEQGSELRGVWVSTIMNLDYPKRAGMSVDEMMSEAVGILDGVRDMGLNAVFFQVRPATDAFYNSQVFPWSQYITGEQGRAPEGYFDPLAFWIQEAHARGIELHAWINPYRVSHYSEKLKSLNDLAENNPARLNPSWVVKYSDGGYYFDPALSDVRNLVIQGIIEIIMNYDVDGIHLDDYFYPGTDFKDDESYALYGEGINRDDWRRENVNKLIRGIQSVINHAKPEIRFGISPFAIWQNQDPRSPLGSATRGLEAYRTLYADTYTWVKEGWLDYICPQIYWNIGYAVADYSVLLSWWANVCEGTDVDLYIGHAVYREAEGKNPAWNGETIRQLQLNKEYPIVKGSIFFRYGIMNGSLAEQIRDFYK